jgi:uncharacterized protein YcbK (DUF882 family)
MLFIGDDGRVSYTAAAAFHGLILFYTWYICFFFLGWDFPGDALTFMEFLIGVFFGVRGLQRGIYLGADAITSRGKARAKAAESEETESPKLKDTPRQKPAPPQPQGKIKGGKLGYFSLTEFDSNDGARMPAPVKANVLRLIENLNVLREVVGAPITITSGYRSPGHNAKIGGAKESKHMEGMAADFQVDGKTPKEIHAIIEALIKEGKMHDGGLGLYLRATGRGGWIHYDIGESRRWKG